MITHNCYVNADNEVNLNIQPPPPPKKYPIPSPSTMVPMMGGWPGAGRLITEKDF